MMRVAVVGLLALLVSGSAAAGSSCGGAGEACCANRKCSSGAGSCLATSSDPAGVCAESAGSFAGAFGTTKRCDFGNVYLGDQCACPHGFAPECTDWESFDTETGALLPASFCVCKATAAGTPFTSYGGVYAQTSAGACSNKNSLTGGCTCKSGTAPTTLVCTNYKVSVCQSKSASNIVSSGMAGFLEWNSQGTCVGPNVLTGKCSCPSAPAGYIMCPYGGLNAVPQPTNNKANEVAETEICALAPQPLASAAISFKTGAISRLMQEGLRGEIALNQQITLPNERGHDYSVSGIRFTSLKFTSIKASIVGENQIKMTLAGGSMQGSIGRIRVKKSFIHANCDAHPFDLAAITVAFTLNGAEMQFPGGRFGVNPNVAATAIQAAVGQINVDVHGGAICSIFKHKIEDAIKSAVTSSFATMVPQMVQAYVPAMANDAAQNISSYDTNVQVAIPAFFAREAKSTATPVYFDLAVQGCSAAIVPPSAKVCVLCAYLVSPRADFFFFPCRTRTHLWMSTSEPQRTRRALPRLRIRPLP
jgi:hypothetical protein